MIEPDSGKASSKPQKVAPKANGSKKATDSTANTRVISDEEKKDEGKDESDSDDDEDPYNSLQLAQG